MVRLLLVRHGQTPSNVLGLLDSGAPGPGLTDLGRVQAAALVERLAGESVDRIVASTLVRAQETAAPLAEALRLPVPTDAGLREIEAGDLEMRDDRASILVYLDTAFAWAAGDATTTMPGAAETGPDFLDRYDRAVEAAVADGGTVVCVSHGAAIRVWACARATNVDAAFGTDHGLPNTGIVVLEREEDGPWRVTDWLEQRFVDVSTDPTGAPVPE